MEVTGGRGRRNKQLLDDGRKREDTVNWKRKYVLDGTVWRTGFGRGYGPVVRQTMEWMFVRSLSVETIIYARSTWRVFTGSGDGSSRTVLLEFQPLCITSCRPCLGAPRTRSAKHLALTFRHSAFGSRLGGKAATPIPCSEHLTVSVRRLRVRENSSWLNSLVPDYA
jgi:hypothetical protein